MKIQIINGPNLNLLGRREPEIYGHESFMTYFERLRMEFGDRAELSYFQSNGEGELISQIQAAGFDCEYLIVNLGGYSHTSIALADAIAMVPAKVIEVHISHVFAREDYRHVMITASRADGCITGFGLSSYALAIEACLREG